MPCVIRNKHFGASYQLKEGLDRVNKALRQLKTPGRTFHNQLIHYSAVEMTA